MAPDSAHRYTDRYGIGQPRRVLRPLAGAVVRQSDGREWRDTAEVVGRTMAVGLVMGNDASPTHYGIVAADASGFVGRWENTLAGNFVVVDDQGRPLPNPAGHFCARLLSSHP